MANPQRGDVLQLCCRGGTTGADTLLFLGCFSQPSWFQEQGRTDPRSLHSIASSPAKHLSLLGGELGAAPRGREFVLLLAQIPLAVVQLKALARISCRAVGRWRSFVSDLLAQLFVLSAALALQGRGRRSWTCLRAQTRPQIIAGLKLTGWAADCPHSSTPLCGSAASGEDHTYP